MTKVEFKKLRDLIKEDREITDITARHNWLIDKWVEYSEKKDIIATEYDNKKFELLFNTNWNELNKDREKEGLLPIIKFNEREQYVTLKLLDIDTKLVEINKILDYLATRR